MAESVEELKSLLMKVKEGSEKVGLTQQNKLNPEGIRKGVWATWLGMEGRWVWTLRII